MKQPRIRYLDDAPAQKDDWYVLEESVIFRWKEIGYASIPAGYVSDGCSVPRILWGFFPPKDAYFVPGLVHDYLYETKQVELHEALAPNFLSKSSITYPITRRDADRMFLSLLNHFAPHTPRRNYVRYLAVRWFGGIWWRNSKYIDITNYKEA